MTAANPRNNKKRGASDEREVARLMGGTRHWADTGGPEDCAHPLYALQVKGGKTVTTGPLREGVASAIIAAEGTGKVPVCVLVDRRGTRLQRYAVIPLEAFIEWQQLGLPSQED